MNIKSGLVALGAISLVVLGNSATANAQTAQTETQTKVVVKVQAGDTLDAIATALGTSYIRLFNANESIANPDLIDIGDEVRIPTSDEQLPDRLSKLAQAAAPATTKCDEATQWVRADNGQCLDKPGVYRQAAAQPVQQTAVPASSPVVSGSRNLSNGWWCTDYVKSRRPDVPIYGNAGMSWISAAQADGKATGTAPRAGAVAVMPGHVAYVESVNADGSYVISEMGWMYQAGNYNIRTVQPGAFGGFIY